MAEFHPVEKYLLEDFYPLTGYSLDGGTPRASSALLQTWIHTRGERVGEVVGC